MNLTDRQLEVAARELCRLRDEDPDEFLISPIGTEHQRWKYYVPEIRKLHEQLAALAAGQRAGKEE